MNQSLLKLLLVLSLCLMSACSSITDLKSTLSEKMFGREPVNPPAELSEIKPTISTKIDWSTRLGKTGRYDLDPVMGAGYVYAADAEGELVKVDATTGKQQWRINAGEPISGGVGYGGGIVLVGTSRGNVMAYDLAGKLLWKAPVSSEVLSAPQYFDGYVIVRTGDSHIFGFDAADGTRKWVYERTTPALSLRSSAGVVVDGGAIYAGFPGGKMIAIRADNGKLLWEATVALPKGVTEIERISDITSTPVVEGPIVYAVAYQGRIAAVDRLSGKVMWNRDISSYSGMSIDNGNIFVSHALGSVYSLDHETGRTFWRQGELTNRRLTAPLPMNDVVAVGDLEGYIHFLNRENGKFSARIKVDDRPIMALAAGISANQAIATTRDGGLYAVSTK